MLRFCKEQGEKRMRTCRRAVSRLSMGLSFAVCTSLSCAFSADAQPRDPTATIFVDLTQGRGVQSPPARANSPTDPSVTTFVDLTGDHAPASMPVHSYPASRTPRTHLVDLSNGGYPPPVDEVDDITPPPDAVVITADALNDPYEERNRARFKAHVALHRNVIDPVETVYVSAVPRPLRAGLHNFLTNLEMPSVFVNDVLQAEPLRASATLSRFLLNSTIGIAGIFDVATDIGVPYRDDDFGQTLAAYGVSDYPYLLIPVIGPSNPRDLTGKVVDFLLNPLHYVALPGGLASSLGRAGAHELDKRSVDVGQLDELDRTVPDAYVMERRIARERRNAEIAGQPTPP